MHLCLWKYGRTCSVWVLIWKLLLIHAVFSCGPLPAPMECLQSTVTFPTFPKYCALVISRGTFWFEACHMWMQGSDLLLFVYESFYWSSGAAYSILRALKSDLWAHARLLMLFSSLLSSLILWLDSQSSLLLLFVSLIPLKGIAH